jgi:hypothetical protein
MFYRNTQESNSKIDIWKEKNTENSSPLINNKRIAVRTRLFIAFLALAIISSVLIISHTQNEVLAKKTTGNKSGIDGGYDAASPSGNNTSDTTLIELSLQHSMERDFHSSWAKPILH